ncbi:hypothetical protein ABL78_4689 [Leptomonas seymouri]|uniref:K Homology domain-containing protein n=1 Tax=Leptomonas seymouri TaxID=5684 RepID=A0A0N1I372_LEPSE|nr:hypothetical protein ABL78_4689 [Leptomonas seymouri]|eukprot:KPI86263.1 hypothetical protein ABL78_4689 [Leptomonas seymouri]
MTQTEIADPRAAVTPVNPPSRYPHSMLLREIDDVNLVGAFKEEESLRAELDGLRDKRHSAKAKLDALLRNHNTAKNKVHQKFDAKINGLHIERRRILDALDALRERQGSRASARDKLTDLDCKLRIATRAYSDAEASLSSEQERLKRGNGPSKASEQKKILERCRKELAAKKAEKMMKEEEYAKARAEFNASAPDSTEFSARDEEFRRLHGQLNATLEELEKANKQRRLATAADGDAEVNAARAQHIEIDAAVETAERRLAEIRAVLFPASQYFTYNAAYHQALIGRSGATLRQLQEDFGVAICIDMVPPGHGFVVGGAAQAEACIAAITAIVGDEEMKNTSATLPLAEQQLRKELIGPRGSTVERFQDEYDVRVHVDEEGVTITGRQPDVAEAKEAIRVYLDSLTQRKMTVPVAALPSLLGRGGRNIACINDSSGVRALRVDRERGVVKATGTPEAIERAFALCRSAIGEGEGVTKVVHADAAWIGAVIGPRGATIRQLEEETNTHIQCRGSTISLTGTQEEVNSAYERIVALRRRELAMPVELKQLHFLTSSIVLLPEAEGGQLPTAATPPVTRSVSRYITPLEAVRRVTHCDQVFALRSEGRVVLHGPTDAVSSACDLLRLLLRHNEPFSINVAFLDVLRNFMTRRRREWDSKNLLDYVPSLFKAPVRIEVDWAARRLTVSSCSESATRAATNKLVSCLRDYSATHVRLISNFPDYAIPRLLGTQGSTIRKLQEATGTEITLVRDRAQVQVLHAAGDVEKLESAVHVIRAEVFGEEEEKEAKEGPSQFTGEAFAAQTPTSRPTAESFQK